MAKVHLQPAAQEDYLAIEAGQALADRFLENTHQSFDLLASQPQIGTPLALKDVRFGGLRKWAISGFANHLIFYFPRNDGVAIVRVLHGASNWWDVLGIRQ